MYANFAESLEVNIMLFHGDEKGALRTRKLLPDLISELGQKTMGKECANKCIRVGRSSIIIHLKVFSDFF